MFCHGWAVACGSNQATVKPWLNVWPSLTIDYLFCHGWAVAYGSNQATVKPWLNVWPRLTIDYLFRHGWAVACGSNQATIKPWLNVWPRLTIDYLFCHGWAVACGSNQATVKPWLNVWPRLTIDYLFCHGWAVAYGFNQATVKPWLNMAEVENQYERGNARTTEGLRACDFRFERTRPVGEEMREVFARSNVEAGACARGKARLLQRETALLKRATWSLPVKRFKLRACEIYSTRKDSMSERTHGRDQKAVQGFYAISFSNSE